MKLRITVQPVMQKARVFSQKLNVALLTAMREVRGCQSMGVASTVC